MLYGYSVVGWSNIGMWLLLILFKEVYNSLFEGRGKAKILQEDNKIITMLTSCIQAIEIHLGMLKQSKRIL